MESGVTTFSPAAWVTAIFALAFPHITVTVAVRSVVSVLAVAVIVSFADLFIEPEGSTVIQSWSE